MSTKTQSATTRVSAERLWRDLMEIAELTEPDAPYSRRAFTALFEQGRAFLKSKCESAGLSTFIDAGGNLIARIDGSEPELGTIMVGSHSDTVPGGGRFDGVAGVIAAVEIARTLVDLGFKPRHNLEFVDYLAEEVNDFGLSCIGSRSLAGVLDDKMLDYTDGRSGEKLAQAIERVGGKSSDIAAGKRSDVVLGFELHIEQGPILEAEKIEIGVVTSIVGIRRLQIVFKGEADHAGTMPMDMRHDASIAAAETILFVRQKAAELAQAGRGHFVATIGVVDIKPNAANIVPESATLVVDSRCEQLENIEEFYKALDEFTVEAAARANVSREKFVTLSNTQPTMCDARVRNLLSKSASELGYSSREMASGAGHDTVFIAKIAPAGMVFVPCKSGKSHASEEWAEPEDLAKGAEVILQAIMTFDREQF